MNKTDTDSTKSLPKLSSSTSSSSSASKNGDKISSRMKKIIDASRDGCLAGKRCHFIGVGGIGMSALARLAQAAGAVVSGSDQKPSDICDRLSAQHVSVQKGHNPKLIADAEIVVFSSAIQEDNPEMQFAQREGLKILSRAQMLTLLMQDRVAVGVTGAHGKTSTTWMSAHLLIEAGLDPSVVVGGIVPQLGENYRIGVGNHFVAEIDESDGRLVQTPVDIAVVTNVDLEHVDHYKSIDDIIDTIRIWASHAHTVIGCGDDDNTRRLLDMLGADGEREVIRYGFNDDNHIRIKNLNLNASGSVFDVESDRLAYRGLTLSIPGRHMVLNAVAALTVATRCGTTEDKIRTALAGCRSVKRRFEVIGISRGVRIVDDYAHHPTEIAATLKAARPSTDARLVVVFQPHRYTRTQQLAAAFAKAFDEADILLVMDVYAASEQAIKGVSGLTIIEAIEKRKKESPNTKIPAVLHAPTLRDATDALSALLSDGDTLMTMGAGDVWRIGHELVQKR